MKPDISTLHKADILTLRRQQAFAHRLAEIVLVSSPPPDRIPGPAASSSTPAREELKHVKCISKHFHRPALRPAQPRLLIVDAPLLAYQPAS